MPKWTPYKRHPGVYEYQTKKGKRFGVRRTYDDAMGERKEFSKSGFIHWQDADIEIKQFEAKLARGEVSGSLGHRMTVDQYYQQMAKRKMKMGIWRESTARSNKNFYSKYLKPAFGKTPLQDVSRAKYQRFLDELSQSGLALTTVHTIDAVMKSIMNTAEFEDVIDKNRLRGMQINGKAPRNKDLEPHSFELWLNAAKITMDKYEMALIITATLGLRRGEVMGLRNESIKISHDQINDADVAQISIDMQRNTNELNGGPLKTKSSYRTIWAFGKTVDYLKYAMVTANNLRQRNHIQAEKHWLWLNNDGNPLHPTHLNRLMRRVSNESGVEVYPHLLRHYFATQAIAANKPQIDVMHYLGHKNLQMTADYTRSTKAASLNVFNSIDKFL